MRHQPLFDFLVSKCKGRKLIGILAEAEDPRIEEACKILLTSGALDGVHVFGKERKSFSFSHSQINWLGNQKEFIDKAESYVHEKFKEKGKSRNNLRPIADSPLELAASALALGFGHGMVAGACHPTSEIIRTGLTLIGLKLNLKTLSGSFVMEAPNNEIYIFADCGVVIQPTPEQLAEIASESMETFRLLSEDPISIAFLSFSTHDSASHPLVEQTREATALFSAAYPEIKTEGPIQFDAAWELEVAARKIAKPRLTRQANILIFPDLQSGNICYKMAERIGKFKANGPILQGMRLPYSDLSRGATPQAIATTLMISLLRAQKS